MKNETRFSREFLFYCLLFVAALTLRLTQLGKIPLINSEAAWAFQAWQIKEGMVIPPGSQIGYLAITEALFTLFGGSDFLARFWPALAGSLVIWIPYLLRQRLGNLLAMIMAFGVGFDPALVSVSRIAAGPIPALVFLLLSATAFDVNKKGWFVVFLGLGMYSGSGFWFGAGLLALTALISNLLGLMDLRSYLNLRLTHPKSDQASIPADLETFLVPALILIMVGSFFFTNLQGLSAWPGAVAEMITGLFQGEGIHPVRLLINLAVSNPLILGLGISGFISSLRKNDLVGKVSMIWFLVSLLVLLIISGRQSVDLIWLVVPLWISSAGELLRIYQLAENTWVFYSLAGLVATLIVLNWLTFTGMVFQIGNSRAVLLQWGLIAASVALVILSMTIAASEYGWSISLKGFGLGLSGMLLIFMLSALVQGSYLRQGDPRSIWSDGTGSGQITLLRESIYDASITQTGRGNTIQGVVVGSWDVLRWALRDLENIEFQESLDPDDLAPLLITSKLDSYRVNQELYRGQDFILETRPGWPGLIPPDWISWIAFRSGDLENEDIILWVRNDIYSGY